MKQKSKRIEINAKGDSAEILIYDDIGEGWYGGLSAKAFAEDLKTHGKLKKITVRISSGGGDVFEGIAIYNSLVNHPAKVSVKVDGLAASIASIIAMAGDEIEMSENAFFMVHEPWSISAGSSDDFRTQADLMDKIKDTMLDTYVSRSSISLEEIADMVAAETWLTASEALEAGLITTITEANKMAASTADLSKFKNAPEALLNKKIVQLKTEEPGKIPAEPENIEVDPDPLGLRVFHNRENLGSFFK